ncbi:hypothetical protein ACCO45_006540 [Purpureocillium lilacinum]|uniref:Uncharacterized protein n=1 Tax=Purpureocillium lilacinum TaxID=33203 RepID=A0ACC4DQH9_PURLI
MSTKSTVYTTDHSSSVLRTHGWRTAANSAGYLIPHLRPETTILDVGCGPGSITVDLARLVPQGHVTGIEYVPDPLDGARALAVSRGVTNVTFAVADVHSLPFDDDSFDVVHAHQVLQHIADPVKALREMRRVAKPGGLVACRESASMTWHPPSRKLDAWYRVTTEMAAAKGGNPHPGSRIHVWAEQAGVPARPRHQGRRVVVLQQRRGARVLGRLDGGAGAVVWLCDDGAGGGLLDEGGAGRGEAGLG